MPGKNFTVSGIQITNSILAANVIAATILRVTAMFLKRLLCESAE
jgi:hypothetical protein